MRSQRAGGRGEGGRMEPAVGRGGMGATGGYAGYGASPLAPHVANASQVHLSQTAPPSVSHAATHRRPPAIPMDFSDIPPPLDVAHKSHRSSKRSTRRLRTLVDSNLPPALRLEQPQGDYSDAELTDDSRAPSDGFRPVGPPAGVYHNGQLCNARVAVALHSPKYHPKTKLPYAEKKNDDGVVEPPWYPQREFQSAYQPPHPWPTADGCRVVYRPSTRPQRKQPLRLAERDPEAAARLEAQMRLEATVQPLSETANRISGSLIDTMRMLSHVNQVDRCCPQLCLAEGFPTCCASVKGKCHG